MKLTIGKQISATCIMIIFIFMIMDVYMYYRLTNVEQTYQTLLTDSTEFTSAAKDIRAQLWIRNTHIRNYILKLRTSETCLLQCPVRVCAP